VPPVWHVIATLVTLLVLTVPLPLVTEQVSLVGADLMVTE
jgi:hypothetical protein